MQLVVLSARPGALRTSLAHWRAKAPWLDRVLIVTPEPVAGLACVLDRDLLGGPGPADHSARNYALRAALATCDAVDDVFVSADDDSRPLVDVPATTFVRDGRYRRFAFGSLDDWEARATSMDNCLLATRQVLALHGLPRRAYAAHMPQVVDKVLWAEVVALFAAAAARHPLDEWSTYLNAAPALHPQRFEDPEPYLTLGWPDDAATWQPLLDQGALLFENVSAEHYAAGQVFDGIDPDDVSYEAAVDKVVRWRSYELQVLAGERPAALAPPLPSGTLRRVRAQAVGDPVLRDRRQRAATAAVLRALGRR